MDIELPWVRGTQEEKSWKFQQIGGDEHCVATWGVG